MSGTGFGRALAVAVVALVLGSASCAGSGDPVEQVASGSAVDVALLDAWFDEYLDVIAHDQWMTPPRASRDIALIALTMHEAMASVADDVEPLTHRLETVTIPDLEPGVVDARIVVGAAVEYVLGDLWQSDYHAALHLSDVADRQAAEIDRAIADGLDPSVIDRSAEWGQTVAAAVVAGANDDGYHLVRQQSFEPPDVPGAWVRTGALQRPPVEPHWGSLRPWVPSLREQCRDVNPVPYSDDRDSMFFAEAMEVYRSVTELDDAGRQQVVHWADEPRQSFSVPGHWIRIARAVADEHDLDAAEAMRLYARVALAVADAAIVSWHTKYATFLIRPETYIQLHIDPEFRPVVATPPFPAYTSGHSVFSYAAAGVITDVAGPLGFTDDSGARFGRPERRFESPLQAASDAASSRVLGGIHYPMDSTDGRDQGSCVAAAHAAHFAGVDGP